MAQRLGPALHPAGEGIVPSGLELTMNKHRLIVVEGMPGSGKTSMARYIREQLEAAQVPNALFVESDLNHPAEYEGVAWFTRSDYTAFLDCHPTHRALIGAYSWSTGEDCFVSFGKLEQAHRAEVPPDLIGELAQHTLWVAPTVELYCRLRLERWKAFSSAASLDSLTYIFECCLIQNPMAALMIRHNAPDAVILEHIRSLLDATAPLHPLIIYLYPQDTRAAWDRITAGRPAQWINDMIAYSDRGQWNPAHQLSGYESVVAVHEQRKQIEMRFLQERPDQALLIDVTDRDWDRCKNEVATFLSAKMGI
jgi:hypothetical protein